MKFMKQLYSYLKPYLKWLVIGLTLFFLAHTLKVNWKEVAEVQITRTGWGCLALALSVTLTAHFWSGWVWLMILQEFNQSVGQRWGMHVYLKTNLAKYLPGNVWHFYGRINAVNGIGVSLKTAVLSVLLEPILMASAALMIALVSVQQHYWGLQVVSLILVMFLVHPRVLNPVVKKLSLLKMKKSRVTSLEGEENSDWSSHRCELERYPLKPFLGEVGFVTLRGVGFLLTMLALAPFSPQQIPLVVSAYSLAWLVGLLVPGALVVWEYLRQQL